MSYRVLRGRRFYAQELDGGEWYWEAWRLFERVSGVASSETMALDAIDHFVSAPSTFKQ